MLYVKLKRTRYFLGNTVITLFNAFFTKLMAAVQNHWLSFIHFIVFLTDLTLHNFCFILSWFVIAIVIGLILLFKSWLLHFIVKLSLYFLDYGIWKFYFFKICFFLFVYLLRRSLSLLWLYNLLLWGRSIQCCFHLCLMNR